jgi:uncharacterized protein YdeI (YjbR/CyaY-like superfamily)
MSAAPRFFRNAAAFRAWLERNHERATELLVGFHKVDSSRPSMTWPQSVDEALCFGWIDGVRRRLDDTSYTIRFSPRRPGSIWSVVNTRRAAELRDAGRMAPAGLRAFAARDPERTRRYSFERSKVAFDAASEKRLRANRRAWTFFQAQPPGYRRIATWYVISAKREDTRARRLDTLIACSEQGERLTEFLARTKGRKS